MDAVATESWAHVMEDRTKNDESTFAIQIFGDGTSAKDAAGAATQRQENMVNLVKMKVPQAQVTLFDLTLSAPQRNPWERVEAPYTAQNTLVIHVDSANGVPAAIDEAIAAGADNVVFVQYGIRGPDKARTEAIYEATEKAKLNAQAEAAALGVKLGPLLKSSVPSLATTSRAIIAETDRYPRMARATFTSPQMLH